MNVSTAPRERLRRLLQCVLRFALRLRSRPLRLAPGSLLVIAPHPDDDAFGCGGLLLGERLTGRPVHLVVLTDGAASHPGHPLIDPVQLARRRRLEAQHAAARLGLDPACIHFFDLPDGELSRLGPGLREAAVARLAGLLDLVRPSAVLVPTRNDGSTEHLAAHALVVEARARVAPSARLLGYPVWSAHHVRWLLRLLPVRAPLFRIAFPGLGPAKVHAFRAHASQLEPTPPWKQAVLPPGFAAGFAVETEFFFDESNP